MQGESGSHSLSRSFEMMPTLKRLVPHGSVIVNANNNPVYANGPEADRAQTPGNFEHNLKADQMQMLRGLFGDGSLNDLLFPTEGVEKLKN